MIISNNSSKIIVNLRFGGIFMTRGAILKKTRRIFNDAILKKYDEYSNDKHWIYNATFNENSCKMNESIFEFYRERYRKINSNLPSFDLLLKCVQKNFQCDADCNFFRIKNEKPINSNRFLKIIITDAIKNEHELMHFTLMQFNNHIDMFVVCIFKCLLI